MQHHKISSIKLHILAGNQHTRTLLVLILFSVAYFFSVLTLQTYTIPRYILPMYPLLFLLASTGIYKLLKIGSLAKWTSLTLLLAINFLALFSSVDPLSRMHWGETVVFNQHLYGVNDSLSGNDGITYNMQYLFIVKKRTDVLTGRLTSKLDQSSCGWLFVDPRNDSQTIRILRLTSFSYMRSCL